MTCPHCGAPDQPDAYCTACGRALPAPPARPGKGAWRRRLAVGVPAGLATLFVVGIIVASVPNPVSILAATVLAVLPTVGYALLVLSLDTFETEPARALVAAFAWGAIGAVAVAVLLETALSIPLSNLLELTLGAPMVEELSKGAALLAILLFYRHELDNVLDGIVYGALIGLGFAMTENILYLSAAHHEGGVVGLTALFLVRGVLGGFSHAAYTAVTGAAIGWSREQHGRGTARFVVPVAGLALAIALHAAWNGGATLLSALDNGASSLVALFLMVGLIVLPATGVLLVVSRVASRRELDLMRRMLLPEVARGTLTPEEYLVVGREDLRPQALLAAELRGGRRLRAAQRRFFQVAAELAFRREHAAHDEPIGPAAQAAEDAYRLELARLRVRLQADAPGWGGVRTRHPVGVAAPSPPFRIARGRVIMAAPQGRPRPRSPRGRARRDPLTPVPSPRTRADRGRYRLGSGRAAATRGSGRGLSPPPSRFLPLSHRDGRGGWGGEGGPGGPGREGRVSLPNGHLPLSAHSERGGAICAGEGVALPRTPGSPRRGRFPMATSPCQQSPGERRSASAGARRPRPPPPRQTRNRPGQRWPGRFVPRSGSGRAHCPARNAASSRRAV